MQQPPKDISTSWEDLDPEPPRREGLGQRRELILGLVLLLAVVGWAGWQWQSQARDESEYSLGSQAVAANRLDEAEAHFAGISGYKDAGSRAQEVARKIAQRDDQYRQATSATNSQRWLAAYLAAQQVIALEPGYRDTQSMLDQATEHIYTQAISNTVVSRMDASPPGLYYRNGDKWVWLDQSNALSQVRGIGPPGHMVYDVPGANQSRASGLDRSTTLQDSQLMLATFTTDGVSFQPLSLDPSQYDFFIWGDRGLWGLKSQIDDASRANYVSRPNFGGYDITYEAYGSRTLAPMAPKGSGWAIMDLAPDGRHILLSDIGDYSDNNPVTQLYAADGDGTNLHFLYTYIGGFFRALFSPDSKYVLINTFFNLGFDTPVETQAVTLLDVSGQHDPLKLAQTDVRIDHTTYGHPVYSVSFVQSGKYKGDVLLVQWGTYTSISVIDPNIPVGNIVHSWDIPADVQPDQQTWSGEVESQSGLLLAFQSTPPTGSPYLNVAWDTNSFSPNGNASGPSPLFNWTAINLKAGEKLQRAWMRDGYFIYATSEASGTGASANDFTLYSRKLPFASSDAGSTPSADTTTQQLLDSISDPGLDYGGVTEQLDKLSGSRSMVLGPDLLARSHSGGVEFEVKSYDGTATAQLPRGLDSLFADGLYDWTEYTVFRGLR
jgi:hypothetical protein